MTDTVTPIPFRGDIIDYLNAGGARIEWLWRDRQAFIPVRPVCDRLGLAYQPQHRKLTAPESEAVVTFMVTTGADGKRYEMLHLAYEDFLMWLGNITPSRVAPEAREALTRTRREIKTVLAEHFRERLFGETAAVTQASEAFVTEWASLKSWHPAVLTGCRLGWSFQQIRAACRPSTPVWRIADSIRAAFRLGLTEWVPSDLPAPRVAKAPEPKDDPRQTSLFGEG